MSEAATDIQGFLSFQSWMLLLQTVAISVSAVGALMLYIVTKDSAKRTATINIIFSEQSDDGFLLSRRDFIDLRNQGHMVQWAKKDKSGTPQATSIRRILNRYELLALGVKKGIIDEHLLRDYCKSTFIQDWKASEAFVIEMRNDNKKPALFVEFEALAKKWGGDTNNLVG